MKWLHTLDEKQRILLLASLTLVVIVIGVVLLRAGVRNDSDNVAQNTRNPIDQNLRGEVIYTEGLVEYRLSESAGWRSATVGLSVEENMDVRVIGEGRAIVNLDDGSSIRVGDGAVLKLASLDPANILVEQTQGVVFHRVEPLDREYRVALGEQEIRSLGTAFQTFETEDVKGVSVYESAVEVEKGEEKETVEEGKKWYFEHTEEERKEKAIDLTQKEIEEDDFVAWNKEVEKDEPAEKKGFLEESSFGQVDMNVEVLEEGIKVRFDQKGGNETGRFMVYAINATSGDRLEALLEGVGRQGEHVFALQDGQRYEVSVCVYNGFECVITSSQASVVAKEPASIVELKPVIKKEPVTEKKVEEKVTSDKKVTEKKEVVKKEPKSVGEGNVSLSSVTASGQDLKVSWSLAGSAPQGYKVVYSKTSANPTYGVDESRYVGESGATSLTISWLPTGTYYVRVCRYTGDGCEGYSQVMSAEVVGSEKKDKE
jgi:hypothetical protein